MGDKFLKHNVEITIVWFMVKNEKKFLIKRMTKVEINVTEFIRK